jgi:hypothetical protein
MREEYALARIQGFILWYIARKEGIKFSVRIYWQNPSRLCRGHSLYYPLRQKVQVEFEACWSGVNESDKYVEISCSDRHLIPAVRHFRLVSSDHAT